jgi:hypothetical protein
MNRLVALIALALCLVTGSVDAKISRSEAAKRQFRADHVCPATGEHKGRCPGYVIDHVIPLCAGGADRPSNMQWQELAESKEKDKLERKECAALRRP